MSLLLHRYHDLRNAVNVLRTGARERGAMTAEYVGVLLVVAALVAALLAADIDGAVTRGITNALSQLGLSAQQPCTPPPAGGPKAC